MNVALTYDDGPSEWTAAILDTLADHDATATFFVCGAHIPGREHILDRIVAEGHTIGNHTTTHPNLATLTRPHLDHEFRVTDAMVEYVTGETPTLYRPPYLRDTADARAAAAPLTGVGADVVPGDWAEPDPFRIAGAVMDDIHAGAVVLLHDGRPPGQPSHADGGSLDSRHATVEATRLLLPALRDAGYRPVAVTAL